MSKETLAITAESPQNIAGKLSSAILLLLCLLPIVATILFGGVDNITWALVPSTAAIILILWLAIC